MENLLSASTSPIMQPEKSFQGHFNVFQPQQFLQQFSTNTSDNIFQSQPSANQVSSQSNFYTHLFSGIQQNGSTSTVSSLNNQKLSSQTSLGNSMLQQTPFNIRQQNLGLINMTSNIQMNETTLTHHQNGLPIIIPNQQQQLIFNNNQIIQQAQQQQVQQLAFLNQLQTNTNIPFLQLQIVNQNLPQANSHQNQQDFSQPIYFQQIASEAPQKEIVKENFLLQQPQLLLQNQQSPLWHKQDLIAPLSLSQSEEISSQASINAQKIIFNSHDNKQSCKVFPNCQKHFLRQDNDLNYICVQQNCSEAFQPLCQNCIRGHTSITLSCSHEIKEISSYLSQAKSKLNDSRQISPFQLETIDKCFLQNIEGLEGLQIQINKLLESLFLLQRSFYQQKLNQDSNTSILVSALKDIEDLNNNLTPFILSERLTSIARVQEGLFSNKTSEFQMLSTASKVLSDFIGEVTSQSQKIEALNYELKETISNHSISNPEVVVLEKKHKEEKTLEHFSKLFHLLKGHAKKRDVINFLTWEPFAKELKYSKDIKDKHGEHFYVSFSLRLKNIEVMTQNEINESFISKIVAVVEEKAPEIQDKKNQERKKIDPNGKKRKYCRFNPRIEIDVSLSPNSYKNIKIE